MLFLEDALNSQLQREENERAREKIDRDSKGYRYHGHSPFENVLQVS
jgi:hypothetical protein